MNKKGFFDGYTVDVDKVTKDNWHTYLECFDDATIFQTWSYGVAHWGGNNLSHLVLKKGEQVIGLAQLSILKVPIFGATIAYLFWGPVWRLKGKGKDLPNLLCMIRALREEYVVRRGLFLRIIPNEKKTNNNEMHSAFEDEGFRWGPYFYRTILLDLTCLLEDLRKGLNQKWRNQLNRSEKNKLKLIKGSDIALYDKFSVIYNQMLSRKQFDTFVDINQFRKIQETLPDHLKMVIVLCEDKDEPVSTLICSAIGDTGIYLLGATNDQGMKTKGSYLLQWEIIKWLKERNGYRYYDLGGIDPERNPGVYHFKSGLGGKEVEYIGQFDTCESTLNSVLVGCGDELRLTWRKMRVDFNRMKNKIREPFKFRKEEGEKNG